MSAHIVRSDLALERAVRLLERQLRSAARVIASHDRALAADLYQEAVVFLWRLDPSRYADSELGYLRNAAVERMIRLGRREEARRENLVPLGRFR